MATAVCGRCQQDCASSSVPDRLFPAKMPAWSTCALHSLQDTPKRLTGKEHNLLNVPALDECPHRPEPVACLGVLLARQVEQPLGLGSLQSLHQVAGTDSLLTEARNTTLT